MQKCSDTLQTLQARAVHSSFGSFIIFFLYFYTATPTMNCQISSPSANCHIGRLLSPSQLKIRYYNKKNLQSCVWCAYNIKKWRKLLSIMSKFEDNPFSDPTIDNPFAVSNRTTKKEDCFYSFVAIFRMFSSRILPYSKQQEVQTMLRRVSTITIPSMGSRMLIRIR